jgi:hypothetical protein
VERRRAHPILSQAERRYRGRGVEALVPRPRHVRHRNSRIAERRPHLRPRSLHRPDGPRQVTTTPNHRVRQRARGNRRQPRQLLDRSWGQVQRDPGVLKDLEARVGKDAKPHRAGQNKAGSAPPPTRRQHFSLHGREESTVRVRQRALKRCKSRARTSGGEARFGVTGRSRRPLPRLPRAALVPPVRADGRTRSAR